MKDKRATLKNNQTYSFLISDLVSIISLICTPPSIMHTYTFQGINCYKFRHHLQREAQFSRYMYVMKIEGILPVDQKLKVILIKFLSRYCNAIFFFLFFSPLANYLDRSTFTGRYKRYYFVTINFRRRRYPSLFQIFIALSVFKK